MALFVTVNSASIGTAVLTSLLTIAGGYVLLYIQSRHRHAEEARANRQNWHDESVDVITDVTGLVWDIYVALRRNDEASFASARQTWNTSLNRRVRRVENGHPDARMRAAALSLGREFINWTDSLVGVPRDLLERALNLDPLDEAVWHYRRILHGAREAERTPRLAELVQDAVNRTNLDFRPGEFSP